MAYDILIVDDEEDIRSLVSGLLEDEGYHTRQAGGSKDALAEVESRRPNLILLDIWLQGSELDGLGILKEVRETNPDVPVLMMSGHGTVETAVQAIKDGAYDFIEKPFKADHLMVLIERALETASLKQENKELKQQTGNREELIGESTIVKELRSTIDKVAPTNSRVMITGPSGSGKEVVARNIHSHSTRSSGPFVTLNCATVIPEHAEIELFGTEDTDSEDGTRRIGTFEAAHNGTLFLDEVADMPLETQGKIVRVLQEQVFERVGGSASVEVNVRVIAATSRNLPDLIECRQFREDLFYRLNVVPVIISKLTAHKDDIPLLADYFMKRASQASGRPVRMIGVDAMAGLQNYDWPGDIRELRNVIERLLIMAPGDNDQQIGADVLPPEIKGLSTTTQQWDKSAEIMELPLREAREMFERDYLIAQVNRFGGNISRTSEFIGMERSALHRKIKSLGVTSESDKK